MPEQSSSQMFLLVLEEIGDFLVAYHLLIEGVSTSLGALHHLDNLGVGTSIGLTGLERSDCFLCHKSEEKN